MKKQVTVDQCFCDFCGKEASGYSKCLSCGKDVCYDCQKTKVKEYRHAINVMGSGDGLYCLECNDKLLGNGDKLHSAYCKIESLRNEAKAWSEDFRKRSSDAENALKALVPDRR